MTEPGFSPGGPSEGPATPLASTGSLVTTVRRLASAVAYGVLAAILARVVAEDVVQVRRTLQGLASILPGAIRTLFGDPMTTAVVAIGLVAFFLATGTYLVSRRTGTAFALLAIGTVAWFVFPYAQVPWAAVLSDLDRTTLDPPGSVWLLSGMIVAIATAEIVLSARDQVTTVLRRKGFEGPALDPAREASTRSASLLLLGTLSLGGIFTLIYAVYRQDIVRGLPGEPDLIWVPVLMGAAAALAVWLTARSRS